MQNSTGNSSAAKLLSKEPAVATGVGIGVLVAAVVSLLRSFGVNLPQGIEDNIVTILVVLSSLPIVTGLVTRYLVVSPNTAAKKVADAYMAVPGVDDMPEINVQGYDRAMAKTDAGAVAPNIDARR